MPLESATYISDLVVSNPANSDGLNQADDHMRLIKATVKATFPGVIGAATRTSAAGGLWGFLADAGNAAAPAYSFVSKPTLGFYAASFASDLIGFTGTLRGNGAVPAGAILDFAMASVPTGWLVCDGQAVSRTTYADLFVAIGTFYGAGDGSTTFNVPNCLSRFRRHRDNSVLSGALGNLQSPKNLQHTHAVSGTTSAVSNDHTHSFSGTTSSMNRNNPHSHPGAFTASAASAQNAVNGPLPIPWQAASTGATDINHEHTYSGTTSGISANHTHTFSATTGLGSNDDNNEARPYSITVMTCIKT